MLEKYDPSALDKANELLHIYSDANPTKTPKESEFPFVECATLADDIKRTGGGYQSNWHFMDEAFLDQGGNIEDYDNYGATPYNITLSI